MDESAYERPTAVTDPAVRAQMTISEDDPPSPRPSAYLLKTADNSWNSGIHELSSDSRKYQSIPENKGRIRELWSIFKRYPPSTNEVDALPTKLNQQYDS